MIFKCIYEYLIEKNWLFPPSPSIVYIAGGHGDQDNVWKMSKVGWKVDKVVGPINI